MGRKSWGVLVVTGLVAALLLVQSPAVQGQRGGGMRRMAAGDIAAGGGNLYVISGEQLQKLTADLEVAGAVELQAPESMQGDEGMAPAMLGRMARVAADEGGVYRIAPGGTAQDLLGTDEESCTGIAADGDGRLYVTTAEDGWE